MKLLEYYCRRLEHLLSTFKHDDLEDLERSRLWISRTRGGDTIIRPSPRSFHDCSASGPRIRRIRREIVQIEDGARIQKLVHEPMNRLKNCSESDESDARVHESYSQIFDSFDSRFIRKIRKIRVQITPLFGTPYSHPHSVPRSLYGTTTDPQLNGTGRTQRKQS
jgi:hypothetical protein